MISQERFEKGECVLYGARAVCRVSEIGPLPFGEKTRQYYTLRPVFEAHGETIYAPLESRISMRRVMSAGEAERVLAEAAGPENERAEDPIVQQEALQSQDCRQLMGCVKALRRREAELLSRKKHLREADRKFLEHAEKLLYGELAAALDTTPELVRARTEAQFGI